MSDAKAPHLVCWNCGTALDEVPRPISRHEHCPECFEALHCCRLCRHYRAQASITCDEDRADPPVNKENANFCDYFRPVPGAYGAQRGDRSRTARAELDALFGSTETASDPTPADASQEAPAAGSAEAARARLDALFGDTKQDDG
jgi:hypothetical protein